MKRFVLKVVVFLAILESISGFLLARQHYWYADAADRFVRAPVRFVFIGSSRVAQAVVAETFSGEMPRADDIALNLGRGYSTLAEHFFGLRRLAAASPRGLRGAVVFLEAPEGMPDLSRWTDPWFQFEDRSLLRMTMRVSDLPAFWSYSTGTFEDKVSISVGEVSSLAGLRGSWSYYARAGWHALTGGKAGDGKADTDLSEAGGVQTGREMFIAARNLAEALSRRAVQDQSELNSQDVERSILLSLASFLKKEGADFVAFTMPMSSVQQRPSLTEIGRKNRELVAVALKRAGVPLLRVGFPTTDDDFPDLWHLRKSRAPEFSRALARAYLASRR
jgi:hypothetical protein